MGSGFRYADHAIWTPCYVALGSNLDQPARQISVALDALKSITATRLITYSSQYESMPLGPQDQPNFVNSVAGLLTQLEPQQLLQQMQAIERRMGRQPSHIQWGPRVIDLDLLLFGELQLESPQLQLPHPGMLARNFVMAPLAEIAPQLPVWTARTAAQVAQLLGVHGLRYLSVM